MGPNTLLYHQNIPFVTQYMAKILYYGGDKLEHPGIGDVVCIPSYRYDIDRGLGVGHAGYKDRYHATPQHPSGAAAVAAYVACTRCSCTRRCSRWRAGGRLLV